MEVSRKSRGEFALHVLSNGHPFSVRLSGAPGALPPSPVSIASPLGVPASVTVLSTSLATTVQRAQVCACWGGEVSQWKSHLDVSYPQIEERRIEIIVDGLLLFHGVQLAVDTTLVSPLSRRGGTCQM